MKLHSLHVVLTALAALVVVDARPPPSGQTKTDPSAPRGPRINPGTPKYFCRFAILLTCLKLCPSS